MNATILTALALALAWWLTGLYLRVMLAYGRLEPPSDRGMHKVPVPSGAGAAIIAAALVLWPLWQGPAAGDSVLLLATVAALALISWLDDRRGLSPAVRLVAHAAAVTLLLASLGPEQRVLPALPLGVERVALGLAWLWFINLFNFMDGIDGIAGAEAVAVAAGYVLVVDGRGRRQSAGPAGPDRRRGHGRLPVLELAPRQGVHGRHRVDRARLPARLADDRSCLPRNLGGCRDPAAVFRCRCHPHAPQAAGAR